MSDSDYALISGPLCKSKTLWNIFMILGRNVELDQTTCLVQGRTGPDDVSRTRMTTLLNFGIISLCYV